MKAAFAMVGGDWLPFSSGCFDVVMSKSKYRGGKMREVFGRPMVAFYGLGLRNLCRQKIDRFN